MKSVGCFFIEDSVRKAGFDIEYKSWGFINRTSADVILISVHHVTDMFYLINYNPKPGTLTIIGGHVMNNPYYYLHFGDVICVGEGESWIVEQLRLFRQSGSIEDYVRAASQARGTLTKLNMDDPVDKLYEKDISINDKYMNSSRRQGHSDTWYVEIARGCRSKCNYCELGWTNKYRENSELKIMRALDEIKDDKVKRVNIFAPDDFSCSFYNRVLHKIHENKLVTKFGSMRVDRFSSMKRIHKKNFLFRLGVDGLSERIRNVVNKNMSDDKIVSLFDELIEEGFVRFKMFFVFSYQFEEQDDFKQFKNLILRLKGKAKKLKRPVNLRLKFTPFIPHPLTPMERFYPNYNMKMRQNLEYFFADEKMNRSNIVIENDGIMQPVGYHTQAFFTRMHYGDINPTELDSSYSGASKYIERSINSDTRRIKVRTAMPIEKRDKAFRLILDKTKDFDLNYYDGIIAC